jgi:RNA polymerase sigma factor (sigma-70 family)
MAVMHAAYLGQLVTQCRELCAPTTSDFELLSRFAHRHDADAFAQLVHRHAASVWAVCRRLLVSEADREDALQATFLALVRQAAHLDRRAPLGCWLHTTAWRIARKAQVLAQRLAARALPADHPAGTDPLGEVSSRELLRLVDEEIERLPQRLRAPLVLCCLEGRTRDEAAQAIGCSVPVVKSRLERARCLLRQRLQRRGIALPTAFLVLGLGAGSVGAALEAKVLGAALRGAPASVAALAAAASAGRGTLFVTALSLVGICLFGVAAFGLVREKSAPEAPETPETVQLEAARKGDERNVRKDAIGDPLPEAALLRLGTKRFCHPNSAAGLALSPDAKTVVTLGWEGLYAWDTATGAERWHAGPGELQRDLNPAVGAHRLAFCPDSTRCISLGRGPDFKLWDVATGKATTVPVVVAGGTLRMPCDSLDLSPDGNTLALGSEDGLYLCDLTGKVSARIHSNPVGPRDPNKDRLLAWRNFTYGRFAPDGKTLAVVSSETPDVVRICKTNDGSEQSRVQLGKRYLDSAFSPDGRLIAVAERDDTVRVYELRTGKRLHAWPVAIKGANENYIFQVVFAPDGKTVAASSSDNLIRIWDLASGAEAVQLKGHRWYPWGLAFTSDSKTLYSTGWDGDVRRWDPTSRKQIPLPVGIRGSAVVAAAPDGKGVVYVDGDRNLRFVDTRDGRELRVLALRGMAADQLLFAPDGRRLAVGGTSGTNVVTCLLDVGTGKVTWRRDWAKGRDPHAGVTDLAFTTDGRRLAAMVYRQGQARIWDLRETDKAVVLKHSEGYGLSFSPDGKTLATAGWDKRLRFWDPTSGALKKEHLITPAKQHVPGGPDEQDTRLFSVAYSPDGTRIAGADLDGRLWQWDADSLAVQFVIHTDDIFRYNCMRYSPDGLWLATGGASGSVKLWDAMTGQLVWNRGAHAGDLYTLSFGAGSRRLLSGATDGLGYLWDLRPKDLPAKKLDDLYADLVGADGPNAYRAFWALLDQPDAAVPLLSERGRQMQVKVRADQIEQWIAALDSSDFATREAATKDLGRHLLAAGPVLHAALANQPTLEQRRRIENLLQQHDRLRPRMALMVSVLSHLETPAARRLLDHWAETDPTGPLGGAAALAKDRR